VLGLPASSPLSADTIEFSFVGSFTMLNDAGSPVTNSASPYVAGYNDPYDWNGKRTPIVGSITYDTVTGAGVGTIAPFLFFGTTPGILTGTFPQGVTFQNIDTAGGMIGSLLFSWNGLGHSVSIVLDASGMLANLGAPLTGPSATVSGVGALPATDSINFGTAKQPILVPLGPAPLATRTINTGNGCDAIALATQVSPTSIVTNSANVTTCTTGMADDGVGGDPMTSVALVDFNANLDFTKLVVAKKNGVYAPPSVIYASPADGETSILVDTTVKFSFVNPMDPGTVAFTLKDAANTPVPGTLTPNSGAVTRHFTFTPTSALAEPFTYTATIASATDDNGTALSAPVSWSFITGGNVIDGNTCTVVPQVPLGSNFTMLVGNGGLDQGTNDVSYSLDTVNLNTTVNGTTFGNSLSSPTPYYGRSWTAHHFRLFGPGTWTFDTTCTVAQLGAGISDCNNPLQPGQSQRFLTMTVGAGQIGAHLLLDWNHASDIDVVNVWDRNAQWNDPNGQGDFARTNDLWTGGTWAGPDGLTVNPLTTWQFVSTDPDGDGINGVKMVDGPFIGFSPNFNLSAADSCIAPDTTPDPFSFVDQTGVALGTEVVSNPITVTGIDTPAGIIVIDGEYSVNGGVYTSAFGTVNNGDVITVRHVSAPTYDTTTSTTLIIDILSDDFSSTTMAEPVPDTDSDGIADSADNCTQHANADQRDTNGDGYGNRCDADFDNNGFVNFADQAYFKSKFGTSDPDADLDGNGFVNFADQAIFKSLFGKPPGPSGLVP
jgi:hypothetical protein